MLAIFEEEEKTKLRNLPFKSRGKIANEVQFSFGRAKGKNKPQGAAFWQSQKQARRAANGVPPPKMLVIFGEEEKTKLRNLPFESRGKIANEVQFSFGRAKGKNKPQSAAFWQSQKQARRAANGVPPENACHFWGRGAIKRQSSACEQQAEFQVKIATSRDVRVV